MTKADLPIQKRHCIAVSAPLCTVPSFKDDNHWYLEVCETLGTYKLPKFSLQVLLSHQSFKTRFQEFSRSDK
jgi:hypothetical protein